MVIDEPMLPVGPFEAHQLLEIDPGELGDLLERQADLLALARKDAHERR